MKYQPNQSIVDYNDWDLATSSVITGDFTTDSLKYGFGPTSLRAESDTRYGVAVLEPDSSSVSGTIHLEETGEGLKIDYEIRGLSDGLHGFHIHEYGDLTDGCTSACAHFNPDNTTHGSLTSDVRHMGDLGNISSKNRVSKGSLFLPKAKLDSSKYGVLGRMMIVHADEDDLGQGGDEESLKTGNAGKRLACGVIGLAEPPQTMEAEDNSDATSEAFDWLPEGNWVDLSYANAPTEDELISQVLGGDHNDAYGELGCPDCGNVDLFWKTNSSKGQRYRCLVCEYSSNWETIKTQGDITLQKFGLTVDCPLCDETISAYNRSTIDSHLRKHRKEAAEASEPKVSEAENVGNVGNAGNAGFRNFQKTDDYALVVGELSDTEQLSLEIEDIDETYGLINLSQIETSVQEFAVNAASEMMQDYSDIMPCVAIVFVSDSFSAHHVARYRSQTVGNCPIIMLSLSAIKDSAAKYDVPLNLAVTTSVWHELGHALDEYCLEYLNFDVVKDEDPEDFAESFARWYSGFSNLTPPSQKQLFELSESEWESEGNEKVSDILNWITQTVEKEPEEKSGGVDYQKVLPPDTCVMCSSDAIEQFDDDEGYRFMYCVACEAAWREEYGFVEYEIISEGLESHSAEESNRKCCECSTTEGLTTIQAGTFCWSCLPINLGAEDNYDSTYGKAQAKIRRKLKNKIKKQAIMGTKAGQWSARKSQELKRQYEAACSKKGLQPYKGKKTKSQENLSNWSKQGWKTASGKKSSVTGEPYFPAKAVAALKQRNLYAKAKQQKQAATKAGKQNARYSDDIRAVVKQFRAEDSESEIIDILNWIVQPRREPMTIKPLRDPQEPMKCIACDSDNINAQKPDTSKDNFVTVPVECNNCGQEWTEIYKYSHFVDAYDEE
ncbi:MAG: superoxide dismutase family protein [Cyanophyceae cyanobacterium]